MISHRLGKSKPPLNVGLDKCGIIVMTPPLAYAIFFFRGITRPEWGINTAHIIWGVIPFVILVMVGMGLFIAFSQLILWLPGQMIR